MIGSVCRDCQPQRAVVSCLEKKLSTVAESVDEDVVAVCAPNRLIDTLESDEPFPINTDGDARLLALEIAMYVVDGEETVLEVVGRVARAVAKRDGARSWILASRYLLCLS